MQEALASGGVVNRLYFAKESRARGYRKLNESSEIRPGLRKKCDGLVRIPLANNLDSLNAAVAAGPALKSP